MQLQLDGLEKKLQTATAGSGAWSDHDVRTMNALSNQYRLLLRELRNRPTPRRSEASLSRLIMGR
jgi:hypothetical protein